MGIKVFKNDILKVKFMDGELTIHVARFNMDEWLSHKADMLRFQSDIDVAKKENDQNKIIDLITRNNLLIIKLFENVVLDIVGFVDEDDRPLKYNKEFGVEWLNNLLPVNVAFNLCNDIVEEFIKSAMRAGKNEEKK